MGGLFERGWGAQLILFRKTMVSALHKELEYKEENLKYKEVGGHAAENHNEIRTCSWYKTIPDQSTRSFTVMIDYYSLSFISEE